MSDSEEKKSQSDKDKISSKPNDTKEENNSKTTEITGASTSGSGSRITPPPRRTESNESIGFSIESIRQYLQNKLGFSGDDDEEYEEINNKEKVINNLTVDGLINEWENKGFKNIITMVGAGISTAAGIPDFRSPGCGLYDNLKDYNLPTPEAVFSIDYFRRDPEPFFKLAKDLYPSDTIKPTTSHYFVKLLEEKGILLRHYTQNIDGLERLAGISEDKLVEAHGTFYTNKCLKCFHSYSVNWVKEEIFKNNVPTCTQSLCNGVVKPDIVFFGESLPVKFYTLPDEDFKKCDLLIIMGTSLKVEPFASLIEKPNEKCLRLLINREPVGINRRSITGKKRIAALCFNNEKCNTRDIALIDDCDNGVLKIVDALGWTDELKNLMQ